MREANATDRRLLRHIVVGYSELRPDFKIHVDRLMQARAERARVLAPSEPFARKTGDVGMIALMYPGANIGLGLGGRLLDHFDPNEGNIWLNAAKALGIVFLSEAAGLAGGMVAGNKVGKLLGRGVSAAARGAKAPRKAYSALRKVRSVHKGMNAFISEYGFRGMVENTERRDIDFDKLNKTHFAVIDGEGNLHFFEDNGIQKALRAMRRIARPTSPEGKAFRYRPYS